MHKKPEWLEPLFPWDQKEIQINGRLMAYVDEGQRGDPPVMLLHGNPTWGFLYRDFIEPLKKAGFRVIVPDCIGAGYSSKPRTDAAYSMAHHIADLVALIDGLDLREISIFGQDWGGPQGTGAALNRLDRIASLTLANTWLFTDYKGAFHQSPRPWTTWHAPIIGPLFMKRFKVLSGGGPSTISKRGMTRNEKRAYHHVFDEPDSETVTLTWPRTIPLREGDRGWADMTWIQSHLGDLKQIPVLIMWGLDDAVFDVGYRDRLFELLPHAEGPINYERAAHFLQDDRGADIVQDLIPFLTRVVRKT